MRDPNKYQTIKLKHLKPMVNFHVTNKCNMNCIYCGRDQVGDDVLKQHIRTKDALALIAGFARTGDYPRIKFSSRYGEPTSRKDLETLIEFASEQGFEDISLSNNGSLLERRAEALKNAGLNRMCISLDTLSRAKFSRITRSKLFDKVIAGIETAAELFPNEVKLNIVVVKGRNEGEIFDIIEWAHSRGITPQLIEITGRPDPKFIDKYLVDLDPIVEQLASQATFVAEDRKSKRTTIILPTGHIEVRRTRRWPAIYYDWTKVLIHPDGQFGTYMNYRPGIKPETFQPDSINNAIQELKTIGPSSNELITVGTLGNRPCVS